MQAEPAAAVAAEPHPKGLYVLFFTEMWERFSYYGMRALLVLYMVNYFKWSQERASGIYKWYTSLVYLTPLLGGYLADRYLGNKRAVVIGAILMSIGHFLMAFDAIHIFYIALVFLIFGNGMFKPNMSTQVGRLYSENDPRRDGAYTIFYMGINLGAGLSPLVCGYLHENYGFHYGFAAAGVGMVIGLITYLVGLPWVKEISGHVEKRGGVAVVPAEAPSALPWLGRYAPHIMLALALAHLPLGAVLYWKGMIKPDNLITLGLSAVVFAAAAWIVSHIKGAARDKVMAIYLLGIFVVAFWAAFEQAGNAMNLWADQVSNRYVTAVPPVPSALPPMSAPVGFPVEAVPAAASAADQSLLLQAADWWHRYWNPVSTEAFQSINAVAIFALAPLFAWLWTFLARRNRNPSIPTKMAFGVAFMSAAFGVMIFSAKVEDQPSQAALARLPPQLIVGPGHELSYRDPPDFNGRVGDGQPAGEPVPAQGGRLRFEDGQLKMRGVLADVERDRMLRATAPIPFVRKAMELAQKTNEAVGDAFTVEVTLDEVPPGFDLRYAGFNDKNIRFNPATRTLTAQNMKLADKDYKTLLQAAAEPGFRDSLGRLYVVSQGHKVSSWWLVWFYILSTLGELCLSPVGLSMVSKLAPARFATMLMGIWLITTAFGNFVAGAAGEYWGTVTPTAYFAWLVITVGVAAAVLFVISRRVFTLMHGVK